MSLIVNTYNCKTRDQLVVLSEIPVHADPFLIWNTLTASQHLLRFNPFIISHEKGEVDGKGYEDCCTYENGKVLFRQVVEYEEGFKIKYRVNYADQFHNSFTCFEVVRARDVCGISSGVHVHRACFPTHPARAAISENVK